MANFKKTSGELRAMAAELTSKAKALTAKADQMEQEDELELLRVIKKAGKIELLKQLAESSNLTVLQKAAGVSSTVAKSEKQLDELMQSSFESIQQRRQSHEQNQNN